MGTERENYLLLHYNFKLKDCWDGGGKKKCLKNENNDRGGLHNPLTFICLYVFLNYYDKVTVVGVEGGKSKNRKKIGWIHR